MVKIYIGKADCIDNETFEAFAESVGLSCFEESGDPKDVDSLTLEAQLIKDNDSLDGCLVISKDDLDFSTFEDIRTQLEAPKGLEQLIVQYRNPEIK